MVLLIAILLAFFVLDEPWNWVVLIVGAILEVAETTLYIWWSKRRKAVVGAEALIGRLAVVAADCLPEGQVRVAGELWQARCDAGARAGEEVVVREVEKLTLVVEPT